MKVFPWFTSQGFNHQLMSKPLSSRHPLRASLGATILVMGVFSILMVFVAGEVYRGLIVDNRQAAIVDRVEIESSRVIGQLKRNAEQLGLTVQGGKEFRRVFKALDVGALRNSLKDHFYQYFVTAEVLRLVELSVFDKNMNPVVSAAGRGGQPVAGGFCAQTMTRVIQRQGADRLKVHSELCYDAGAPYLMLVVPVGAFRPIGFLRVITDPSFNLISMEQSLDMPVRLENLSGQILYSSDAWQDSAPDEALVTAEYLLRTSDGNPAMKIWVQRDMRAFFDHLAQTRLWIMGIVAIATLLTVLAAFGILQRVVFKPLQHLTSELRRVGHCWEAAQQLDSSAISGLDNVSEFAELRELYETLGEMALTDSLTSLPNRLAFERELDVVLTDARTQSAHHALAFMDLDQFKVVNDTCGHAAGDELLRQLAVVMNNEIRGADMLARFGGDEFGLLLRNCHIEQAYKIADQIRSRVEEFRFIWEDKSFAVGVSVGLLPIAASGLTSSGLFSLADAACYTAKDQGRNRIHVLRPEDMNNPENTNHMQWVARITRAIDEDGFCLFAQPIVQVGKLDRPVEHYEMLIRMRAEDGEMIPPMAFIPAAERYGIMPSIDRWTVRAATNWVAQRSREGKPQCICSINLSALSICDQRFLTFVINLLDESGVDPHNICFEITETAAMANMAHAIRFLSVLKSMGCRFSLDDFGIGLASFSYLKQLKVDFLKIDGVFIRDVATDAVDFAMVESINHVGHVLGFKTIAECVSDQEILDKLTEIGVDYVQGAVAGMPVSVADIDESVPRPRLDVIEGGQNPS